MVTVLSAAWLVLPVAPASAVACSGAPSDFNGDGYSDAAVADPGATVAGDVGAGRVVIMYGDADTRVGEGSRTTLTQDTLGGVTLAEPGDQFGFSLATADLDGDGCTDLIVGSPYEDFGAVVDSGIAHIVYGSLDGINEGLGPRAVRLVDFGLAESPGDTFGYAVDALDDVEQGGTPDPDSYTVGFGAPGVDVGGLDDAGWAGFLSATDGGNTSMWATQDTPGVAGTAEAGDRFGSSISVGYLTGSAGVTDAAVGAPFEDLGDESNAGSVTILTDLYDSIESGVALSQDTAGVPGTAEAGDRFGASLDTVGVGSSTYLAVGVPRENIGSVVDAGQVNVFRSATRTSVASFTAFSQDSTGITGTAETGDFYGAEVAFVETGPGVSETYLVVSAPTEDGDAVDSGAIWRHELDTVANDVTFSQATAGVIGGVDAGDRFGNALAVVIGDSESVILVGVPDDVDNSSGMVNVIPFVGAGRAWIPGQGGVPAGATSFGAAIGSSVD